MKREFIPLLIFLSILTSCQFTQEGLDERSNMNQEIEKVRGGSELQKDQQALEIEEQEFLGAFKDYANPVLKAPVLAMAIKLGQALQAFYRNYESQLSSSVLIQLREVIGQIQQGIPKIEAIPANADGQLPMEWTYTAGLKISRSGRAGLLEGLSFGEILANMRIQSLAICDGSLKGQRWPIALQEQWLLGLDQLSEQVLEEGADLLPTLQEKLESTRTQIPDMLSQYQFLRQRLKKTHPPDEVISVLSGWCQRSEVEREKLELLVEEMAKFKGQTDQLKKLDSKINEKGEMDLGMVKYSIEKLSYQDLSDFNDFEQLQEKTKKWLDYDFMERLQTLKDISEMGAPKKWIAFKKFKSNLQDTRDHFQEELKEERKLILLEQRKIVRPGLGRLIKSQISKDLPEVKDGLNVSSCLIEEIMASEEPGCLDEMNNGQVE